MPHTVLGLDLNQSDLEAHLQLTFRNCILPARSPLLLFPCFILLAAGDPPRGVLVVTAHLPQAGRQRAQVPTGAQL